MVSQINVKQQQEVSMSKSKSKLQYGLAERLEDIPSIGCNVEVAVAIVISMSEQQSSVVNTSHIRDIFKNSKALLHKHGGPIGRGYIHYNILSFSDRLTRELKSLEKGGALTTFKIKNKINVALTEKGLEIFKIDNFTKTELALWLTSKNDYERNFVAALSYVNSINTSSNQILAVGDLAQLSSLLGKAFISKNKELYAKLQNSIKFQKVAT